MCGERHLACAAIKPLQMVGRRRPPTAERQGVRQTRDAKPRRGLDKYIRLSILTPMGERARIFQNGGSQAVRLPKSCRFKEDQDQVIVRKVGKQVILEPADEWPAEFLACLGAWHDDIPKPPVRKVASRRNPFES